MAGYRFFTADMLTGRPLAELPLDCSQYSQALSGTGAATATLTLTDGKFPYWRNVTTERRTTLNILRDGVVVWGGPILKRHPISGGDQVEFTATTWEGYLARRRIKSDLIFDSADLFDIIRAIVANMQSIGGGNVRMRVDTQLAGHVQTITYNGYARTKVLDAITHLSQLVPAFEFSVSVDRDTAGYFTPTLHLALPRFSMNYPPILVELPGAVVTYDYPEDGANAANAVTGIGKGDGASMLTYEAVDSAGELAEGYPIYEDELSAKEEDDPDRLAALTDNELTTRLIDYVVPTVDLQGTAPPVFGSYALGTDCRMRITSPYHPAAADGSPGLDVTRRVTAWTVKPQAQETVTLALASGQGKVKPPRDATAFPRWLADLEKRVRTQETAR